MPRAVPVFLLLLAIALSACQRAAAPLPQEAYVWQRQWTPALADALRESQRTFSAYRVLAAETDRAGGVLSVAPDLHVLAQTRAAVTAVLRLNGGDPAPDIRPLVARIADIVRDWRAAGVQLAGIEIDHDCATARLPEYARLLVAVRAEVPGDLRLSITALPAWMTSTALRDVLSIADESVLQVHAVRDPARGLFDSRSARRWIAAYAQISPRPFRVSLPAYGVRVAFGTDGRAVQVSAEMPRDDQPANARELQASPQDVAALLRGIQHARPSNLAGVVWFRLPTALDRRAWSLRTLQAVIAGEPLSARLTASIATAPDGAGDIVLTNEGNLDAPLPALGVRAQRCLAADAAGGYRARQDGQAWAFDPPADSVLRAARSQRVGWLRCAIVEKVNIDEVP
jgi:hypothetical protein